MAGIDFAVWLALLLSIASAILCVGYGLIRWNADDDSIGAGPGTAAGGEGADSTSGGRDPA